METRRSTPLKTPSSGKGRDWPSHLGTYLDHSPQLSLPLAKSPSSCFLPWTEVLQV